MATDDKLATDDRNFNLAVYPDNMELDPTIHTCQEAILNARMFLPEDPDAAVEGDVEECRHGRGLMFHVTVASHVKRYMRVNI